MLYATVKETADPTEARKAKLLKLIAAELIVIDQCAERHILAQKKIASWREECDSLRRRNDTTQ